DYDKPGISAKYRGALSPLIIHAVNKRNDVHVEKNNCHPKEIRRYYRQLDYKKGGI
ncbi:glucosamine-fructose-6-phosphate aminotransferase, partial [Listeria monocytogenes]